VAPDYHYSALLDSFDYALVSYLDDFLLVSYEDEARTASLMDLLGHLFHIFGIKINLAKSVLQPVKCVEYLGYYIYADGQISISPSRYAKLHGLSAKLI
jgi:hypothetical protein